MSTYSDPYGSPLAASKKSVSPILVVVLILLLLAAAGGLWFFAKSGKLGGLSIGQEPQKVVSAAAAQPDGSLVGKLKPDQPWFEEQQPKLESFSHYEANFCGAQDGWLIFLSDEHYSCDYARAAAVAIEETYRAGDFDTMTKKWADAVRNFPYPPGSEKRSGYICTYYEDYRDCSLSAQTRLVIERAPDAYLIDPPPAGSSQRQEQE